MFSANDGENEHGDSDDGSHHSQEDQQDPQERSHASQQIPMMDEIAEADRMNVGMERDPAELLAMLADDAPIGAGSFRASTPLVPAPQSYLQQERARFGQNDHVNRVAQPHPQHFPQCRPGPVHQPGQSQAMNFNHFNINAAPNLAGSASARPQHLQNGERMRHKSEELVRVPTKSAQPFNPARSAAHDRGSTADKPLSADAFSGQVPNSVLVDIIRMLATDRNQANNQQSPSAPRPSTSSGINTVQQQQRFNTQAATPANVQQATPFPPGWQMVALPGRRLIAGVMQKAKPPSFCMVHYAVTQQTRLGKITEVNAQNCRDSSYLRLMQKLGLDILSVQNNVEVSII